MKQYNPQKIEPKWQKRWEKNPQLSHADDQSSPTPRSYGRRGQKRKFYCLSMFPYPSGEGLHVGHVESYTATDIISRYKRMQGFNVIYPTGWDAFGLPAENYAIKIKTHPAKSTQKSIDRYREQMKSIGFSYDWSREVNSSLSDYYQWTQWFFLLLFKRGLAYRKKARANWCPKCQTTLANEQVVNGCCERCETEVVQKKLNQWFFGITRYADQLLSGLEKVDWPENLKEIQKNWIGRSRGVEIVFDLKKVSEKDNKSLDVFSQNNIEIAMTLKKYPSVAKIKIFTTRPDTLLGATFMVLAPDGITVKKLAKHVSNKTKLQAYQLSSLKKNELQRTELNREKTGIELKGLVAVNPVSGKPIPVWVGDYVMGDYGSGAIMAVPAHDSRDFEFAFRHDLPIERVVYQEKKYLAFLSSTFVKHPKEVFSILKKSYFSHCLYADKNGFKVLAGGEPSKKLPYGMILEIESEKEVEKYAQIIQPFLKENHWSEVVGGKYWQFIFPKEIVKDNADEDKIKIKDYVEKVLAAPNKEKVFDPRIALLKKALKNKKFFADHVAWTIPASVFRNKVCYAEKEGRIYNSTFLDGMSVENGWEKMAEWLSEKGIGRTIINYRLRDWLVSRQRYWGAPIPIVYCEECGIVPVPEKELPVELPYEVDFVPTGESPLKRLESFWKTKCPKCQREAERETDTMDTFVCSSWYYYRFCDPRNEKEFAGQDKIRRFMPVDLYIGGVEHAVLHLLYSRFFTQVLQDAGYVDFSEPFLKLRNQGIILGPDHNKMSKSKGNVVNPDEIVAELGADTLRLYEMFMGPLEEMKPWDTKGIIGVRRFLEKVWGIQEKTVESLKSKVESQEKNIRKDVKLKRLLHQTIKKVTEDIEVLSFNTAISQMMILANALKKENEILRHDYELFLRILAPFAPHLAEEIWENLGNERSIFQEEWPRWIEDFFKTDETLVVIQINGKKRDAVMLPVEITENEAREIILNLPKVKTYLKSKKLRRWVYVPRKIVNIVVM